MGRHRRLAQSRSVPADEPVSPRCSPPPRRMPDQLELLRGIREWFTTLPRPTGRDADDGSIRDRDVALSAAIDVTSWAAGSHTLFVRARTHRELGGLSRQRHAERDLHRRPASLTVSRTAWRRVRRSRSRPRPAPPPARLRCWRHRGRIGGIRSLVYIAGSKSYLGEFRPSRSRLR